MLPKLTIGMAHHEDYDGVFFTLQHLRMLNRPILDQLEFIVVDNSPDSPQGKEVKTFLEGPCKAGGPSETPVQYIPMKEKGGTTQTRQAVFDNATGEYVLCMDCHVLVVPGAIAGLIKYMETTNTDDLITGPLLYDDMFSTATQFNNVFRSQMWGVWGTGFSCPCGYHFTTVEDKPATGPAVLYRSMGGMGDKVITGCEGCGKPFPQIGWHGHEAILKSQGYGFLLEQGEPFEVPAQGLGLFASKRESWLGFNEHFRGFGGEEFYIHEKYRQAGRRTMCLPFLQWDHRFARPGGIKYPLTAFNKVRNYIVGFQELGMGLDPVWAHFVDQGPFPQTLWDFIIKDPIGNSMEPILHQPGCNSCREDIQNLDAEGVYGYYLKKDSDFNQHYAIMRAMGERCETVVEFGKRDYGIVPFIAAGCKKITTYNQAATGAAFWWADDRLSRFKIDCEVNIIHADHLQENVPKCDLLFIDQKHNANQLNQELEKHGDKVHKYIIIHDTELHGMMGDNGQAGLKPALILYLRTHPEWTVIYDTKIQYGLMILSRCPEDKPKRPGVVEMGANYLKHLSEHLAEGGEMVTDEHLEMRLNQCWLCPSRTKNEQCSICGCPLVGKAKRKASYCDANKWLPIDKLFLSPEDLAIQKQEMTPKTAK